MDEHAVVLHGEGGVLGLLAVSIELRLGELDVVGLPGERGEAHVHERAVLGVDAAALVVLALEAEAVEHLHLVTILQIDAAVAAILTAPGGLEGQEEFNVQREVGEDVLRRGAAPQINTAIEAMAKKKEAYKAKAQDAAAIDLQLAYIKEKLK